MLRRPRSRTFLLIAALLGALAALLAPAAAAGAAEEPLLSPALAKLAEPRIAAQSVAGQDAAIGLSPSGPGSLMRIGGSVIVEAHFDSGAIGAIPAVKEAGARVIDAGRRYQALALSIDPRDLDALAAVPGVEALTAAVTPRVSAVGGASTTAAIPSNGLCEGGSVITQGLGQLNVDLARAKFGPRGAGETIAVLSDSFNSASPANGHPVVTHADDDEVTNDLPGPASTCSGQQMPVNVIAEAPADIEPANLSDEGRAMLQVVHDLAPHAQLAFATGEPTELSFALNIEKLAAPVSAGGAGADVIVDDLSYSTEPFYQDGPVSAAIKRVTEKGVLYFSAAANENLFNPAGEEISSWEAPKFRSSTECSPQVEAFLTAALASEGKGPYEPECMDFDPSGGAVDTQFGITVEPGRPLSIDLQWAEPRFGVKTDLFAFLVEGSGPSEQIVAEGGNNELAPEAAVQLEWPNKTATPQEVRLVIARCAGTCNPEASTTLDPRLKFMLLEDGLGVVDTEYPKGKVEGTEDTVGPTIYGHDGSAVVNTIAAVNWAESNTAPKAPEPYSSRGPVTHYFGPVDGTTPAKKLPSPEVLSKPDMTATDCASTTFFAEFLAGVGWEFCGTSEAAEHAATIAALMQQSNPLATPAQIVSAMKSTATKFTVVKSPFEVGAGMVNALASMEAVGASVVNDPPSYVVPSPAEEAKAPAPTVTITKGPKALGRENRPIFEFASNRPVAFTCQIDGGATQPCASPYVVPSALAEGTHGFVVTGTDAQGRQGSSGVYGFTVDTKAPKTKFVGHPKKVVTTNKKTVGLRFRLQANESPVTFYCQIDKEPLRICGKSFSHRFTKGKHAVRVRAKDEAGNLAEKQTVFHFRVNQISQKPRR
ncbi:MAG TPA: S8 family serine peptidase [Solirubrobacterales bacterium]|nr:S8 family serine peptidase [Solirubrobacterales bacterium]